MDQNIKKLNNNGKKISKGILHNYVEKSMKKEFDVDYVFCIASNIFQKNNIYMSFFS